ncbi:MAG TPA: F0F1 ATP synthase subunit B [Candidatus Polarisedimenticolia bacterium]|nr:F0F1 ATP synthase subunit B [Candidatus Polarisedimenticolia bacterium]
MSFGLVDINPGLIIWTLVTFIVLLVVLRLVAWKPILALLEERERTIRESLEQARKAREEAETLMAQHREMIGKARHEMASIIEKAQRDAEQRRADILARAQRDAEEKARQFSEDLDRQKRAAVREVREQAVDLVLAAASRLVEAEMNEERQRKLVRGYLDDLKSQTGRS